VDVAPAASIHLAYYAMLHAATAVLLAQSGDAPKTHAFGRALNKAEKLRLISDYDDQATPKLVDTANLRENAVDFVAYCRALL
jgi:uncharacterized protein (UPF0332 family)